MKHLTRRDCLKDIGCLSGAVAFAHLGLAPAWAFGDDQLITPNEAQLASMDRIARDFMNRCRVPALSVAISRHGQFVYRKAFGLADQGKDEKATPASLFRIASVSKPVTSIAIFTLIEQNRLKLSDFVFGRNGVVGFDYGSTYPDRVQRSKCRVVFQ
jgi:CubicO group peptidase (beta-lactamase class C family)